MTTLDIEDKVNVLKTHLTATEQRLAAADEAVALFQKVIRQSEEDIVKLKAELAEKDKALRFAAGLLSGDRRDAGNEGHPQQVYDWLIRAAQDSIAEQKERDEP